MAAPKKVRGKTWVDRETRLLLEKRGRRKRPTKIEVMYYEKASMTREEGEACKTRLHTLVTAYRPYNDELRRRETPHQAKNHHSSIASFPTPITHKLLSATRHTLVVMGWEH